jgi:hypothetical protein
MPPGVEVSNCTIALLHARPRHLSQLPDVGTKHGTIQGTYSIRWITRMRHLFSFEEKLRTLVDGTWYQPRYLADESGALIGTNAGTGYP